MQLQLGQEVIYLLLAIFTLLSLVLGLLVLEERTSNEQLVLDLERTRRELATKNAALDRAQKTIDDLTIRLPAGTLATDLAEALRKLTAQDEELKRNRRTIEGLTNQSEQSRAELGNLRILFEKLKADYEKALVQLNEKPPIINLSEAQGYTFSSGDSRLSDEFRQRLANAVIPRLLAEGERHRAKVIEVVGHTDEVRVPERYSNLDGRLQAFVLGDMADGMLVPGDNTGLGMARAASVVRHLLADRRLAGYIIVPLSAGQVIDTDGQLSLKQNERDVRERRRIEIRLRR